MAPDRAQAHALANSVPLRDYQENVVNWSASLYHCDNSEFSHKLAPLDLASTDGHAAPGAAAGV